MINVWLETHGRRVERLLYELDKHHMAGSYGGSLNLQEIMTLFRGAKREIERLQTELEKATESKPDEITDDKE